VATNEQSPETKKRNFGQIAANASLVAVIAAWVVRTGFNGPNTSPTLEQGKFYAEIVRMLLYGGGLVCAIVALVSIPKHGRKGILPAALLGLLFNSGYFIRGGPKQLPALRAHARALANESSAAPDATAQAQPRAQTPPAKEVINYAATDFQQLDKICGAAREAAIKESAEDALVLQTWAAVLETLLEGRQKAMEAEKALIAANVLNPATIKSTDDFVRRRWIANAWSAAVHESELQFQRLPGLYSQQLAQRGVQHDRISLESDRLSKNLPKAAIDANRALHGAEQAVAVRFNYAVSALETEWSYSRDRTAFQPREDSATWNENIEALRKAQDTLKRHRQQLHLPDPWASPKAAN
jgi:hypothetical protein